MSLAKVVRSRIPNLQNARVHELSSRGPFVAYLRRHAGTLSLSEYFDGVGPGEEVEGVRCEDVERLTFEDGKFDLITSTDVFEHVAKDSRGFSEVLRVLGQGGQFIFTVPIRLDRAHTVERAVRGADGVIAHLLPPEYHGDRLRGSSAVLSFRDYALDLEAKLILAGFVSANIVVPDVTQYWGCGRAVIVANRA
jgi:SAM-dependent methyltransferase